MARVPYVDLSDQSTPPELEEVRSAIVELRGSPHNIHRALANQPSALRAFMQMSRYVRDESSLEPRLRELATLAVAYALNMPYEIHAHLRAARRIGVPERQLAAFPDWAASDAFDGTERAVLSYADQVARRWDVDDATFEQLRQRFSLAEIVDLAVIVSWYHFCSAVVGPLHIEPDPTHISG